MHIPQEQFEVLSLFAAQVCIDVKMHPKPGCAVKEHALVRSMKGKMEPEKRQALIEEGKKIKEDRQWKHFLGFYPVQTPPNA